MEELNEIKERIAALEHLVNDVLIGGLKKANDEYIDEDNFKKFNDNYGELLAPYVAPMKAICGDEYDLPRDLYDFSKKQDGYGTDDYDEKSVIDNAIETIKSKIAAINNVAPSDVSVEVKTDVDTDAPNKEDNKEDNEEEEIPSDEQLAKEFAEAMGK